MARILRVSVIVALLSAACTSNVSPPTSRATGTAAETSAASGGLTANPSPASSVLPTEKPPGIGTGWALTASFATTRADLYATYATDVVAWNGRFVAIGRSDAPITGEGGDQRLWTSDDGRTWTEQDADFGTDDASLAGLAPLADGRLLALGTVGLDPEPGIPPFRPLAWVSNDAVAWTAVELPVPDGTTISSFADGAMGYVFTLVTQLWFSADGQDWASTREGVRSVHAGDEGFVGIMAGDGSGPATVVASADGVEWFISKPIGTGIIDVAPLGGDWLATTYEESTISVWWSADGLDWERVLDVNNLTGPDGPKAGLGMESGITSATLSGAGDLAVLTLSWNHCCAQLPVGVGAWTSTDGRTWNAALEPEGVVEAAAVGDVTVLVGFLNRGEEAAFWVGE